MTRIKLEIGGRCGHGHLLTEENTYRYPNGKLVCKQCRIRSSRKNQGYSGDLDDPIGRWRGDPDKPECANGHAYTPENTYINTYGNKVCIICRDIVRFNTRAALYGLTPEQLQEKIDAQDGHCAICNEVAELAIDHDHSCCETTPTCGKCTRDLICHNCNNGLGRFHDSIPVLQSAIEYLERHNNGE